MRGIGWITLGFVLGFSLCMVALLHYYTLSPNTTTTSMLTDDNMSCANLSLADTSFCLRDYVGTFYNYTVREDVKRTLSDIKENGGDCFDYSYIYFEMLKSLGFNTEIIRIEGVSTAHVFTLTWDNNITTYCKLDQTEVECVLLGDGDVEDV